MPAVPLLISLLVGFLLGLLVWGFFRIAARRTGEHPLATSDELPMGVLVLAAFAIGAFMTYILLH